MSEFRAICTADMIANPTADVVCSFRAAMGMTQSQAAAAAGLTLRGWQNAEIKGMKAQTFELLLLKTSQHPFLELNSRK